MRHIVIDFDRIARTNGMRLDVTVANDFELCDRIHAFAAGYCRSANFDVAVDHDTSTVLITGGAEGHEFGRGHITIDEPAP